MSKELEALQKLRDLVENLTRIDYVPTDLRDEVKALLINSYEDSNGYFSQIEKALTKLDKLERLLTLMSYHCTVELKETSIEKSTKYFQYKEEIQEFQRLFYEFKEKEYGRRNR